jgi:acetyl-CoA C-acetyltransferase
MIYDRGTPPALAAEFLGTAGLLAVDDVSRELGDIRVGDRLTADLAGTRVNGSIVWDGISASTPFLQLEGGGEFSGTLNDGKTVSVAGTVQTEIIGGQLRAVVTGMQQIANGDAKIVVAGGQESMSLAPHVAHLRSGQKMGGLEFADCMIKDGLTDVFNGYHMGITAENVAEKWQITREMQDEFATGSQNKAEAAQKAGKFVDEIARVTIKGRKGDTTVDQDEYIRKGATIEAAQSLKPAFKKDGTVTAANASGINDGAAVMVLMTEEEAKRRGLEPLARIASWASRGVDPSVMGTGPIPSSKAALEKAGWKVADLDLVESNEAFAAQALAVNKDMGWDPAIVNVNGGAIAIGHPIGASGARVLTTLLYELRRAKKSKGLATLCIGGGMGIALCVER